jgi:hypothetical protein
MQEENKTLTWVAIVIILVVVIAVAGALILSRNNTPTTTTNNITSTTDTTETTTVTSYTFTLTEQNGSGQNGTVLLEEVGSQVRVTISLSNPTTIAEPAHIHTGSCPTPGAVVFPLENVENGTSVTMINTSLADLEAQEPLAVNIHKSAAESGTYYACGDLDF